MPLRCFATGHSDQVGALPLVNFGFAPGRGPSFNARSSPASTNRCRTRPTVAYPTCNATATASSVISSSAFNRIRARVSVRDPGFPFPISPSKWPSSIGWTVERWFDRIAPASTISAPAHAGRTIWRDGRVVMQRPAKPPSSVRFRVAPPEKINELQVNNLKL
jgi:hypothetical protein